MTTPTTPTDPNADVDFEQVAAELRELDERIIAEASATADDHDAPAPPTNRVY